MALVTLTMAKAHLHVTHDNDNLDIQMKAEHAEAIVLDYLKNRLTSIASVSVANPTVITTDGPHSLTNGASYAVAGTTTTPTVNGAQVVTVTGPTTFTVPVNVTVGQADAAGTIGTVVWTEATVPKPVQAAILIYLAFLYEPVGRGDALKEDTDPWAHISRLLMRLRDPAFA